MAKSIHERVRAAQAKTEKTRKAAEYKAGEPARRSAAGRFAAEVKREKGIDRALQTGVAKTRAEYRAMMLDVYGAEHVDDYDL